jgi:hypothetical protein
VEQQLRPRTAEDIANEQTIERLALRLLTWLVTKNVLAGMSDLVDELIGSAMLNDDDEEVDEAWLDDHHKREKGLLHEAISDGLNEFPDFDAINNVPLPNLDSDIAQAAEQLRDVLTKCAIGATKFEDKFSRAQLERMVRSDLKKRFKEDPKYRTHIREDVPGSDVRKYGSCGRTSSLGTFVKVADYESAGRLDMLLSGGWVRVAKDRIDPMAWSHKFGSQRKSENQHWAHHFKITERNGQKSDFRLPRERLAAKGTSAIRSLMKAGVHIAPRDAVQKVLVNFLHFKPKREILRMPQVGFFQIDGRYICVRSNETLLPSAMRDLKDLAYEVDHTSDPDQYGHQIKGTTADWQCAVAMPLRGNSNVALALATSFASALIPFADEQRGGVHLFGNTGIGKTAILAVGESVYGLPGASEHPRSYGRTWAVTSYAGDWVTRLDQAAW